MAVVFAVGWRWGGGRAAIARAGWGRRRQRYVVLVICQWWVCIIGNMYIPNGVNDVDPPWWVVVGIIECKAVRFRATFWNAYSLRDGIRASHF